MPAPPQSPTPSPTDAIQLTGRERLGWIQVATTIVDLHFALYVDNSTRVELSSAACTAAADGTYTCESPLPPLSNGRHSLELVAWIDANGGVLESSRSTALAVQVVNGAAATAGAVAISSSTATAAEKFAGRQLPAGCGVLPLSGREILTWDSTGSIRVFDEQSERSRTLSWKTFEEDRWVLSGLAAHPQFAENGWIYLAEMARGDEPLIRLVRFRKKGDVLGERAVLFQHALTKRPARVRLSARQEDRLYIALLSGNAAAGGSDSATAHKFLIRLTADGRVPADNARGSVFADVVARRPIDIAWPEDDTVPWVIEQIRTNTYSLAQGSRDPRPASSFSTTSPPVAAQFGLRDGQPTLWIVLRNGDLVSLDDSVAGWVRSSQRRLLAPPRVINDGVVLGGQDVTICGPDAESANNESSGYGIWRVRPRN